MKLLLGLAMLLAIGFMVLDSVSNESMIDTFCRQRAYKDANRYYNSGLKQVDRESQKELLTKCLDENENVSVARLLVKFVR